MSQFEWKPEHEAVLRAKWQMGETAAQIARAWNISKSAVIGKVHRLGLPARESPIMRGGQRSSPHIYRAAKSTLAQVVTAPVTASAPAMQAPTMPLSSMSRVGKCQFPLWRDSTPRAERFFCGQRVRRSDAVYCEAHRAICYVQHPGENRVVS